MSQICGSFTVYTGRVLLYTIMWGDVLCYNAQQWLHVHSHSIDHFVTELDTCKCREFTFPFIVDVESWLPVLCYAKHEKCVFVLIQSAKECPQHRRLKLTQWSAELVFCVACWELCWGVVSKEEVDPCECSQMSSDRSAKKMLFFVAWWKVYTWKEGLDW